MKQCPPCHREASTRGRWQVSKHHGCSEGDKDVCWWSVNSQGPSPWFLRLSAVPQPEAQSTMKITNRISWKGPQRPSGSAPLFYQGKNWFYRYEVNLPKVTQLFRQSLKSSIGLFNWAWSWALAAWLFCWKTVSRLFCFCESQPNGF